MVSLSVVVPVYNEKDNVVPLFSEIKEVCSELVKQKKIKEYEVVFVDDGSNDGTVKVLEDLKLKEKQILHVVELRRNFGQTPALKAGFDQAKGDFVVTMDGDMQNDPHDIPSLLKKLEEGYDVVSGWRYARHDKFGKRMSSKVMNGLRKKLIGDQLHDYGCSLKIYRRECIKDLELFGELHRYITAYLFIKGYRIGEIKVNHRPRTRGITKYNLKQGLNGLFDLVYLKFWKSYSSRPLHFFGRLGIYQWALAGAIGIEQIVKALIIGVLAFGPLLALASMLVITGLITIIFGFLFEMTSRSYFKDASIYNIKKVL